MLTELCQELRNWFDRQRVSGTYSITGGVIAAPFLLQGQYYRIIGSVFNDGVHKFGDARDTLTDETFEGAVWALGIPKTVLDLADEIDAWRQKYEGAEAAAMSPFVSESFGSGGYSYSKGGGGSGGSAGGDTVSWQKQFASQLNPWRKL